MTTKLNRVATLAARFLLVAATGTAILAAGAVLVPEQFPAASCWLALLALASSSTIATVLLSNRPRLNEANALANEATIQPGRADATASFHPSAPACGDLKILFAEFERWLRNTTPFDECQIFLRSPGAQQLVRAYPVSGVPLASLPELSMDSPIARYFQETAAAYLKREMVANHFTPASGREREACASVQAALGMPLAVEDELVGLLFLGERATPTPSSAPPPERLVNAARQLSLAISRLWLREQRDVARDLELLGMMPRGLAHDLNNLITPAWTYLQLCQSGHAGASANADLLPMALRNVEAMREYVDEALFFSQNHQPQFRRGQIHATIQRVIEPLTAALKRTGLQLYTTVEANLAGHYDEILMRRLLANLLNNAIDASPAGSRIDIEAMPLTKTGPCHEWLRLRIRDQGAGMSPENLKHLFNPQLTVADRFSEPRGSGLGLAICQKIVSLHRGELQVTSAVARGTTIEIDFPTASLEAGSAMESLRPDVLRSGLRQQRDRGASPQPQASAERIK